MTVEQIVQLAAVLSAGAFTGGSLFISLVDHAARASLEPSIGRAHFRAMYPRATGLQAPLAASGGVFGIAAWLLGGGTVWLLEGALIGAVVPYTLVAMLPTNRLLMSESVALDDEHVRELMVLWARRHAVRTALGASAFLVGAATTAMA
jgi:hypothetical protein